MADLSIQPRSGNDLQDQPQETIGVLLLNDLSTSGSPGSRQADVESRKSKHLRKFQGIHPLYSVFSPAMLYPATFPCSMASGRMGFTPKNPVEKRRGAGHVSGSINIGKDGFHAICRSANRPPLPESDLTPTHWGPHPWRRLIGPRSGILPSFIVKIRPRGFSGPISKESR